MEEAKYLIIGGGVAGTSAAESIRQNDKDGRLIIVSDEPYPFYSRIMLSKPAFFLGKVPFDSVWLKKEEWYKNNKVELYSGVKLVKLDTAEKTITLSDERKIKYEKLLLAIGGNVRVWDPDVVKGAKKKGVYHLRDLDDAKNIIESIKTAKQAVCVGAGFVSFEMCDLLRMKGIDTTMLILEPYYWANLLDESSGHIVEDYLKAGGVNVMTNEETEEVLGEDSVEGIRTKSGKIIPCQMVIVGIGITCPTSPFKDAGVECGRGIKANEYLETNMKDVWVAGDAAEFNDVVVGEPVQLGNWVNAQMQGRVAGLNMTGKRQQFRMVSFYTAQGFGLAIAFVGDVKPVEGRKIIARGKPETKSYGRILIKENEVVGAMLLNRTAEMSPLSKIIEKDVDVSAHFEDLADENFDLKKLIPS